MQNKSPNRRNFLKSSALVAGSLLAVPNISCASSAHSSSVDNLNIIGPKEGYTPQIGTLVSMLNWMRDTILYPVKDMSIKDLDYIHDENSNSTGAMLWHLAATERFYQLNTFDDITWGKWSAKEQKEWGVAMQLGDKGRKKIKGHPIDFYLEKLESVRMNSLEEFAKRDDEWLLAVDEKWFWGPTNNYCKWFHVCEHESNHNGLIKWMKSRIR
ncbi:MAG: DinB family protein [Bacteroidota bacterium]